MALLENIADMRTSYKDKTEVFEEKDLVAKEPIGQFRNWFETACHTPGIVEPNAMALATATRDGKPSVRMILMKGFDESGFKFFTNYESRKGQELVRVEGKVEKLSQEESESYFHSRPKASQIGACISQQSSIISGRHVLDEKYDELIRKYENDDSKIPKPECWGGYLVRPEVMEFWQGQTNRVHDRLVFRRPHEGEVLDATITHQGDNGWVYERLSP